MDFAPYCILCKIILSRERTLSTFVPYLHCPYPPYPCLPCSYAASTLAIACRLLGHEGGVRAISFAPDGLWAVPTPAAATSNPRVVLHLLCPLSSCRSFVRVSPPPPPPTQRHVP